MGNHANGIKEITSFIKKGWCFNKFSIMRKEENSGWKQENVYEGSRRRGNYLLSKSKRIQNVRKWKYHTRHLKTENKSERIQNARSSMFH